MPAQCRTRTRSHGRLTRRCDQLRCIDIARPPLAPKPETRSCLERARSSPGHQSDNPKRWRHRDVGPKSRPFAIDPASPARDRIALPKNGLTVEIFSAKPKLRSFYCSCLKLSFGFYGGFAFSSLKRRPSSARRQSIVDLALAKHAPVAQLDRVLDSDSKGHRFESCRVRHLFVRPRSLQTKRRKLASPPTGFVLLRPLYPITAPNHAIYKSANIHKTL